MFDIGCSDLSKGLVIVFFKDSKLMNDFNCELKKMKENGELDKLIVKWFDD